MPHFQGSDSDLLGANSTLNWMYVSGKSSNFDGHACSVYCDEGRVNVTLVPPVIDNAPFAKPSGSPPH
eukprot:m.296999 g.296999  ORF g.296999 m.296999 type:complete len:68 (+) comp20073_c0_seq4:1033-1236(+)